MKKYLFKQQLETSVRIISAFFTTPTSCLLSFLYPPSEHLLRGGTMSQEQKGIQSLSERLSVRD